MDAKAIPFDAPAHYSVASKIIHWVTALCVLGLIPVGIVMGQLPEGALQDRLFDLHRSTGVLVFVLACIRVIARRMYGMPSPAATLTRFERIASTAAHHSMLTILFVMPVIGWLMMSAYGVDVPVFGLFSLPPILPKSETTYDVLSTVHAILGYGLAGILVAHIGGALMHGVIKRDGVIQRMLPNAWSR